MGDVVISADGLGKMYRIRHGTEQRYVALRDVMADGARRLGGRLLPPIRPSAGALGTPGREPYWALRDVSFTIQHGERVGIIGRNGVGKSTLLKILSRITDPTTGSVRIRGRVASLLEVGTGFHPELTGRENIYLNGAILGMKRAEIKLRFDEIVAFAEVERFLDTPMKRYSSGMQVRLAFAVAAHLQPDILIVDEVLAVGDASFQKRCLNKMESVGNEGRTVLFVSHNMAAITRLCERAILLDRGQVVADGPAHAVTRVYLHSGIGSTAVRMWSDSPAPGNHIARLRAVRVRNADGEISDACDIRQPIAIDIEYDVIGGGHVLAPVINVTNEDGVCLFVSIDLDPQWRGQPRPVGRFLSTARLPPQLLAEGTLSVRVAVITPDPWETHVDVPDAVAIHVTDSLDGDSARGDFGGWMPGVMRPLLAWRDEMVIDAATPTGAGRAL